MMLDISAAREGFREVISDVGFVRNKQNLADGLTKAMSQATLQRVVATGQFDVAPGAVDHTKLSFEIFDFFLLLSRPSTSSLTFAILRPGVP